MTAIRGVLLDLDGVLHVSMRPIQRAAETLRWLDQHGYQTCFVTNTTTSARATLAHQLQNIDPPIAEVRVMTAPVGTASYIRQHFAGKRVVLLTNATTDQESAAIE